MSKEELCWWYHNYVLAHYLLAHFAYRLNVKSTLSKFFGTKYKQKLATRSEKRFCSKECHYGQTIKFNALNILFSTNLINTLFSF